jgi:hypothetical protein
MSTDPNLLTAAWIIWSTSAVLDTSTVTSAAVMPSLASASTAFFAAGPSQSATTTFAPRRPKECAHAKPIPFAAPVTTATFPANFSLSIFRTNSTLTTHALL